MTSWGFGLPQAIIWLLSANHSNHWEIDLKARYCINILTLSFLCPCLYRYLSLCRLKKIETKNKTNFTFYFTTFSCYSLPSEYSFPEELLFFNLLLLELKKKKLQESLRTQSSLSNLCPLPQHPNQINTYSSSCLCRGRKFTTLRVPIWDSRSC